MRFALFRRSVPDPAHLEVAHEGQTFRVLLRRRPAARRMTLRVSSATAEVVLTVPEHVDLAATQRFADAHGGWIAARLAKVPRRVSLQHGERVPLRGVPHRIVHWSAVRGATVATTDSSGEPLIAVSGDPILVSKRVREFLEREARADLEKAVKAHTLALGHFAKRLSVRDTTTRWGSCSAKGHLSFSWRLVLAPPFVLDYLAAHEVAHLKELNHSHRFWTLVHRLCPRTEEAESWLKRHGTELHRYG
ncbi:MAG TPA: SprT family zinc-dependent metalloprotease [Beijerinckiaceae bacterium]|jgi:predicted metal-dependent hydrolase